MLFLVCAQHTYALGHPPEGKTSQSKCYSDSFHEIFLSLLWGQLDGRITYVQPQKRRSTMAGAHFLMCSQKTSGLPGLTPDGKHLLSPVTVPVTPLNVLPGALCHTLPQGAKKTLCQEGAMKNEVACSLGNRNVRLISG